MHKPAIATVFVSLVVLSAPVLADRSEARGWIKGWLEEERARFEPCQELPDDKRDKCIEEIMENLFAGSRQWAFVADMNQSGAVTISDFRLWGNWLLFYPGDLALFSLMIYAPDVAAFLELTPNDFDRYPSRILSCVIWLLVFLAYSALFSFIEEHGDRPIRFRKKKVAAHEGNKPSLPEG